MYTLSYFFSRPQHFFHCLTGQEPIVYFRYKEYLDSDRFFSELDRRTHQIACERFMMSTDYLCLYSLIRELKPTIVVETGVFDGFYTACFLKAICDNYQLDNIKGRLFSIDLPAYGEIEYSTSEHKHRKTLPPNCEPGWVIPEELREWWRLLLGPSQEHLPKLLEDVGEVDVFFHDSLHTYDHMLWEYQTVWPYIRNRGLLLSHDVHWTRAFKHFVKKETREACSYHGFGGIKKRL